MMKYNRVVTKPVIVNYGEIRYIFLCPECEQHDLCCLAGGLLYCSGCDNYFELGIYKIER